MSKTKPATKQTNETNNLASDVIWGASAIAAELNVTRRRAFYMLDRGYLPGKKIGKIWTTSRAALRAHLAPAPATESREG